MTLDHAKLTDYMTHTFGPLPGPLVVEQFPGGYSNLTYALSAGNEHWVLRRPPPGVQIKSAHDMAREARVLQAVAPHFGKVPHVLAICEDTSVIGAPFFIMQRLHGIIIRKELEAGHAVDMRRLSASTIDTLAEIHAVPASALTGLGHPEGYVERQIKGWTERYDKAKTDDVPSCHAVSDWLLAHQPPVQPPTLIHNDYKYDNLVLDSADPTRVVGVLDWEMATVGDPLMDLGCSLGYWVQADDPPLLQMTRLCATHAPGNMTRAELCARYAERTGRSMDHVHFYYAFGLFKVSVIAQQLYRRYKDGKTTDKRLRDIGMAVAGFLQIAEQAASTGRISFA